jgi:hypothetical protein
MSDIKIHGKPWPSVLAGKALCRVVVSNGTTDAGAHEVDIFMWSLDDVLDMSKMVASLRLSREEALDLARRLIDRANMPAGSRNAKAP